jgi:hypothetical protein
MEQEIPSLVGALAEILHQGVVTRIGHYFITSPTPAGVDAGGIPTYSIARLASGGPLKAWGHSKGEIPDNPQTEGPRNEPKVLYKVDGGILCGDALSSAYHSRCPLCPLHAFLWANAGPPFRRAAA